MDFFYAVNSHVIQFGAGLALLYAAIELFRNRPPAGYMYLVGLCLFSIQLRLGFFADGITVRYPFASFLLIMSIFAIGPLVLVVVDNMMRFALPKRRLSLKRHFAPALVAAIFELLFQLRPTNEKVAVLRKLYTHVALDQVNTALLLGILMVLGYLAYILFLYTRINRQYQIAYSKMVLLSLLVPLSGTLLLSLGFFLKNMFIFHLGGDLLVATWVLIYLFSARHPRFFTDLQSEIKKKRYANTQLTGVNLNAVNDRLRELMTDEKMYLRENVRLNDLAEELLVTPHQLSRILNEFHGKNFNEFVNFYRVEEAKRILAEDRERTVLSVAFEVGFNAKSTFNAQFSRIAGMTPAEFRKRLK